MSLTPGDRLGPYEIVAPIGAGGMGEVYRARDTRLHRDVAVKVMSEAFATDEDGVRRFAIEAEATGALNHPNVLSIYDLGTHQGRPFLVAELLEGESFRHRMSAGPVPLSRALDLARQVALGLDAAHARGITHRDIKPENLFVTNDGRVKILDFGLAKHRAASPAALTRTGASTAAGVVLGTVNYMAPEQVRGEPADSRSDIFSIGVVFYELLTGRPPFRAATAVQTMNAILTEDPARIETPGRFLPPAIERVALRCLQKHPDERFQSARDLAYALEAHAGSSATFTDAVAPVDARRRRPWLPVLTAGLALVGGVLVVGTPRRPAGVDLAAQRLIPFATDAEAESDAAWSPDGRMIAYVKQVGGRPHLFVRTLEIDAPVQLTQGAIGGGQPFWWPDLSRIGFVGTDDQLWAVSRAGGVPELLQPGQFMSATLSPDGATLAALRVTDLDGGRTSTVAVASPPNGVLREYDPAPFKMNRSITPVYLRYAPTGDAVLLSSYGAGTHVAIWRLPMPPSRGEPTSVPAAGLADENNTAPTVAWLPDGRRFIAASQPEGHATTQLWLADTTRGAGMLISSGLTKRSQPHVSPDGTRLVFTAGQGNYDLVEVPLDGSPLREVFATSAEERSGSWVAGSRRFVYVTTRGGHSEIRLRSLDEAADRVVVAASGLTALSTPTPSPDGQRLAYTRFADDVGVWIAPMSGGVPTRISDSDSFSFGPCWSPDGSFVGYFRETDGRVVLRIMRVGGTEQTVDVEIPVSAWRMVPEWSPDGEWIAVAAPGEGIALYSPDGARRRLVSHAAPFRAVMWSADSRTIHALADTVTGGAELFALDVRTGAARVVATYGPNVRFDAWESPALRMTLGPDGRSFMTTRVRTNTDLWILENFLPPAGWRARFGWD